MRLVLASLVGLSAVGCAHTVTNEERLDGMTDVTVDSNEEATELRCRDTSPEVQLARDRSQKKSERLARYSWAVADAKATQARFDEAFRKDPDLVYGPKADEWKRRQAFCVELASSLEKERTRVEIDAAGEPAKAAPAPAAATAVAEKPAPAPARKTEEKKVEEKKEEASAADEAFGDDADQLRTAYKKKAKVAKAKSKKKSKKRGAAIAARY